MYQKVRREHMAGKTLTQEKAIEHYTELQQRLYELEAWARAQGLQFVWNLSSKTWSLAKIAYGPEPESEEEPPDLVQEMHDRIDHDILTRPPPEDQVDE